MTSQVNSLAEHQPASLPISQRPGKLRGQRLPLVPLLLALLAVVDLRVELQILFDHFTFTSLAAALSSHLLAVSVLLLTPSLLRRYRG